MTVFVKLLNKKLGVKVTILLISYLCINESQQYDIVKSQDYNNIFS